MRKLKQEKAITLVALIITIIVMMILVAVSVAIIINSDLLGTAKNAGESYKAKAGEEGNLSGDDVQITVGDKTYNSLGAYTQSLCSHASFDIETQDACPDCGAKKISFDVYGGDSEHFGLDGTYYALEGMTWREWGSSDYCPWGFKISENGDMFIWESTYSSWVMFYDWTTVGPFR